MKTFIYFICKYWNGWMVIRYNHTALRPPNTIARFAANSRTFGSVQVLLDFLMVPCVPSSWQFCHIGVTL